MIPHLARTSPARARGIARYLLALAALMLAAACENPEPQTPTPGPDGPPPAPAPGPTDDPPSPASSDDVHPARRESGNLVSDRALGFETGGATLTAEGAGAVRDIAAWLAEHDDVSLVRIESHTDSDGDPQKSQALSEQRALTVARALVARGVKCERLLPVGFGATKPVASNDTPEGKAENRRTAAVIVGLRGKIIGGVAPDGGGRVAGDPCS